MMVGIYNYSIYRNIKGECAILVNCAGECVKESNQDLTKISYCLRQQKTF